MAVPDSVGEGLCARAKAAQAKLSSCLSADRTAPFTLGSTLPGVEFQLVRASQDHPLRLFHGMGTFLLASGKTGTPIPDTDGDDSDSAIVYMPVHTGREMEHIQTLGIEMLTPEKPSIRQLLRASPPTLSPTKAREVMSLYGLAQAELLQQKPDQSLTGTILEDASRTIPGLAIWAPCRDENGNAPGGSLCCVGAQDIQGKGREPSRLMTFTIRVDECTPADLPVLSECVRKFQAQTASQTVQMQASATFDLLGQGVPTNQNNSLTSVAVDFAWDNPPHVLAPPGFPARAVLKVQAFPGPEQPITGAIYDEIYMLQSFMSVAANSDLSLWPVGKGPLSPLAESDWMVAVEAWAEDSRGIPAKGVMKDIPLSSDTKVLECTQLVRTLPKRTQLDFTDNLWRIACRMADLEQLIGLLTKVLDAVLMGRMVAVVHKENNSPLAVAIRQLYRLGQDDVKGRQKVAETFAQCLEPENALRCLIEIGLDKLRRDFLHYFVAEDVVGGASLTPFLDSSTALDHQVDMLLRLQCVLEVLAARYAVDIPPDSLRSLVASALTHYHTHGPNTCPVFSVSLPSSPSAVSGIRRMCTQAHLRQWTCTLSCGPSSVDQSMHQITVTTSPLFPSDSDVDGLNGSFLEPSDSTDTSKQKLYVYRATRRAIIRAK